MKLENKHPLAALTIPNRTHIKSGFCFRAPPVEAVVAGDMTTCGGEAGGGGKKRIRDE